MNTTADDNLIGRWLWSLRRHHHHFDEIGSTNTQLMDDIDSMKVDATAWQMYTAAHQTAGRGQHGRRWQPVMGNVFLSVYVPMDTDGMQLGLKKLNGLLSLMVAERILHIPPLSQCLVKLGVKWANDLGYCDDVGHFYKLAGILIEPVYKDGGQIGVVIGVGMNIKSTPTLTDGYRATCLLDLLGDFKADLDICMLYEMIAAAICQAVAMHNQANTTQRLSKFIKQFDACHLLTDKKIIIRDSHDLACVRDKGRCVGIDTHGAIRLLVADGSIKTIFAGSVQLDGDGAALI